MIMLLSQLILFLSLFCFAYADYVVYPRIRNNLRLNDDITDSIKFFLEAGNVQTFISTPRQVYEFWLIKATANQAATVGGMVGVDEVLENSIVAVNCGEVVVNATLSNETGNETLNNAMTLRQKNAPQDLDLVSWPPLKNWVKKMPGYDYDVVAGLDTYIYVIDNGINMRNTDFAKMPFQPIEWHFAPSVSKLTADESTRGHGSCTASKATGWTSGVSKNSHLIVMKSSLKVADIHFSFSTALDDILTNGRKRKSVILFPNTSAVRYSRFSTLPKNWVAVKGLIQEAFDNDIPVVVPAGNSALSTAPRQIDTVPALWGLRSIAGGVSKPFPLIVAGSVNPQGMFAGFSQGRMDQQQLVWAPGMSVGCASGVGEGGVTGSGTSLSAGMVAGLVAYKMSSTDPTPGTMAMVMRSIMLISGRKISPFDGPEVIWNGLNVKVGLDHGNVPVS